MPPCILGIVTADMLAARRWPDPLWTCGGAELRADGLPPEAIAAAVSDFDDARRMRGFAGPVLLTLRLRRDGGSWDDGAASERESVWQSLPPGACDFVDLEIEEASRLAPETFEILRSSGTKILMSHHAFAPEEPAAWETILDSMRGFRPDGVKFAVFVTTDQVPLLLDFARKVGAEFPVSCVLGMGPAGMSTRLVSPLLGCPFTYGYLGTGPVAPGQLDVGTMREFFASASTDVNRPEAGADVKTWLGWATALNAQLNRTVMGD